MNSGLAQHIERLKAQMDARTTGGQPPPVVVIAPAVVEAPAAVEELDATEPMEEVVETVWSRENGPGIGFKAAPAPVTSQDVKYQAVDAEIQAEIARLRAENAALKARPAKGLSLKVSEKGALSVYGLGRFPVTIYKEQWFRLLDSADDIRAFIKAHDAGLKSKPAK